MSIKKNALYFLAFLACIILFSTPLYCQSNKLIDSLRNQLEKVEDPVGRIMVLRELSKNCRFVKGDSSLYFAHQMVAEANEYGGLEEIANAHITLGITYNYQGDFENALSTLKSAQDMAKDIPDSSILASVYQDLASVYIKQQKLEQAHEILIKAAGINRQLENEDGLAANQSALAFILNGMKQYEEALRYNREALQIFIRLNNNKGIANQYLNIANYFTRMSIQDSALLYYELAFTKAKEINDSKIEIYSLLNLGSLYGNAGEAQNQYEYSRRAYDLLKGTNAIQEQSVVLSNMGKGLVKLYRPNAAIAYLKQQMDLGIKHQYPNIEADAYQGLADAYAALGMYRKSFELQKKYSVLQDSILNKDIAEKLAQANVKYETEKKDQQIELLNAEKQVNELQISQDRRMKTGLFIFLLLLGTLSVLIYRINANKTKQNQILEEKNSIILTNLEEKEVLLREIHHRVKNNLQVISSLLHLQSKSINDVNARQAIKEGQNRVRSMALIHQNLYQDGNMVGVNVQEYIERLIDTLFGSYNISRERIVCKRKVDDVNMDVDSVIPLGLILNELISNSLKYAFPNGRPGEIEVTLKKDQNEYCLKVKDDGIGFKEDWNQHFTSTMGYRLINAFVAKLKAKMVVSGKDGAEIQIVWSLS